MKRRRAKKIKRLIFFACLFLFLFCSVSYSLLNQKLEIHGKINILAEQSSTAGDMVIDRLEGTDSGLRPNDDGGYNFVGDSTEDANNYIELPGDDHLWRILLIDENGNLKIIRESDNSLQGAYTTNENAHDWVNTNAYQVLQSFYQSHLLHLDTMIVQNPEWILTEATKDNPTGFYSIGIFNSSPIGLIRNDEIDESSISGLQGEVVSSWLNDGYMWTMTNVTDKPKTAWKVNNGKFMNSSAASGNNVYFRPVIYLKSTVKIVDGDGSKDSRFRIS